MDYEMSAEDLSCTWEEDGELRVEELDKQILSKGAWVTIMFLYRDKKGDGTWGPAKVRIQRYRKQHGKYSSQSKFNISSGKQAKKIVDQLTEWYKEEFED